MHRVGRFGVDRRCMTPDDMRAAGMAKTTDDWWVTRPYDGPVRSDGDAQDASAAPG
jgi:hypothetical protein